MIELDYKEVKKLIKEGKIKEDTQIECVVPSFHQIYTYTNLTIKDLPHFLTKEDLKFANIKIFEDIDI